MWVIIPIVLWLLFGGLALRLARRVPRAWRGPEDYLPTGLRSPQTTAARTYLTFTLMVAAHCVGVVLLMTGAAVNAKVGARFARPIWMVGGSLLVLAVLFGLLHLVVRFTNRPRFLIPPRYRPGGGQADAPADQRPGPPSGPHFGPRIRVKRKASRRSR